MPDSPHVSEVPLTDEAYNALLSSITREGLTEREVVCRALQMYDFIQASNKEGARVYLRISKKKYQEVHFE